MTGETTDRGRNVLAVLGFSECGEFRLLQCQPEKHVNELAIQRREGSQWFTVRAGGRRGMEMALRFTFVGVEWSGPLLRDVPPDAPEKCWLPREEWLRLQSKAKGQG